MSILAQILYNNEFENELAIKTSRMLVHLLCRALTTLGWRIAPLGITAFRGVLIF